MFVCRRCQFLTAYQFCCHFVLPLVNWGESEATGLRQFDDCCAAALAEALSITIHGHYPGAVASSDPYNPGYADRPVVQLLILMRRRCHYDVLYT